MLISFQVCERYEIVFPELSDFKRICVDIELFNDPKNSVIERGSNFLHISNFVKDLFEFTWIIAYPYLYMKEIRLMCMTYM